MEDPSSPEAPVSEPSVPYALGCTVIINITKALFFSRSATETKTRKLRLEAIARRDIGASITAARTA